MGMKFNPINFRRLSEGSEPQFKIRTADHTTLILIKVSGDAKYARTRTDKDGIIEDFDELEDLLLFVWVGTHKTDIFLLTGDDVKRFYR